jgi:hypothetical protein
MRAFLGLFVFIFLFSFAIAQDFKSIAIQRVEQRGEVCISMDLITANSVKGNIKGLSFDKIENGRIFFYSNKNGIKLLNKSNALYNVEPIPSMQLPLTMATSVSSFTTNWDAYPTYQQYDSLMHQFAVDYPSLCKLHVLGTLNSGRQILALQLGDNVNQNENELKFLYTSTMHGDEVTGYVMMLRLINYLLENYNSDPQVQFLMNNIDIWINPLANPDGTYYGGNSSVFGATRYNANSVDFNRNFPDPEDGMHPDNNPYQPETQIFMALADSVHFTMSANFHGGAEVVNYPWDTWSRLSADDAWWVRVSKRFADSAQYYSPSGYMTKFGTGYTNGYQWYSISGGRQDYMNYFQHCREATIELSNTKTVAENQLPNYWTYLKRSFIYYLQDATYGFKGQTTDSITHYAVKTKLTILNHDKDSSEVYSNDSGYYFRPIAAGTYDLKFSAPLYYSKTISGISISQDSTILLNVELVPKPNNVIIASNIEAIDVFPNPVNDFITVRSNNVIKDIVLYSVNGKQIYYWHNIESKIEKLNLSKFAKGVYFIKILTAKQSIIQKIIIE